MLQPKISWPAQSSTHLWHEALDRSGKLGNGYCTVAVVIESVESFGEVATRCVNLRRNRTHQIAKAAACVAIGLRRRKIAQFRRHTNQEKSGGTVCRIYNKCVHVCMWVGGGGGRALTTHPTLGARRHSDARTHSSSL
eukprot:SAG11_NODE_1786_length_4258_cov_1.965617_7_plen_138_part_00